MGSHSNEGQNINLYQPSNQHKYLSQYSNKSGPAKPPTAPCSTFPNFTPKSRRSPQTKRTPRSCMSKSGPDPSNHCSKKNGLLQSCHRLYAISSPRVSRKSRSQYVRTSITPRFPEVIGRYRDPRGRREYGSGFVLCCMTFTGADVSIKCIL